MGEEVKELALYRTRETVFYLDPPRPLAEAGSPEDLRSLLEAGSVRWVLARERELPALGFVGPVVGRQPLQTWEVRASGLVLLEVRR